MDPSRDIAGLGRRLRLVFGRSDADEASKADATPCPLIEVVAYAEDCIVTGAVALDGDRLTDMLNEHDEYQLVGVRIERLSDHGMLEESEIVVRRDELLAVEAAGPRGDATRRVRTTTHRLLMRLGPYEVVGSLHTPPGHTALASLRRRRPIVPLTDVDVLAVDGARRLAESVPVVLVNRERVDWIRELAAEAGSAMPELVREIESGPLVRDYTPSLYA